MCPFLNLYNIDFLIVNKYMIIIDIWQYCTALLCLLWIDKEQKLYLHA